LGGFLLTAFNATSDYLKSFIPKAIMTPGLNKYLENKREMFYQ